MIEITCHVVFEIIAKVPRHIVFKQFKVVDMDHNPNDY